MSFVPNIPNSQSIFPFIPPSAVGPLASFPYDIVIDEAYPGIQFVPSEPGGVFAVIREVDGCFWFVNNADYNKTTLQWEQNDPCNPALPAYAWELCAEGDARRLYAPAALVTATAVVWQPLWDMDPTGAITQSPLPQTDGDTDHILVTWNAGAAVPMTARRVDVTDTSSAPGSLLDSLAVNGTDVWDVDKTGTLVVGIVPFSRVTGFVLPSGVTLNNATFTGTSTFNGPVVMTDGLTVTGGETVDNLAANTITVNGIVANNLNVNQNLNVGGNEVVSGNLTVDGATTLASLHVTGATELDGPVTANGGITGPNGTYIDKITGTGGIAISAGATPDIANVDGSSLVQTITSSTITVTRAPGSQTVDIEYAGGGGGNTGLNAVGFVTAALVQTSPGGHTSGPLAGTRVQPLSSFLGAAQLSGLSGTSQTYWYQVKVAGSTPQTIGGGIIRLQGGVAPQDQVYVDGANVSGVPGYTSWTATIPADGNYHTVGLFCGGGTTDYNVVFGGWLPALPGGGLDTTKIASAIAGP